MDHAAINAVLGRHFPKMDNKAKWGCAGELWNDVKAYNKKYVREAKSEFKESSRVRATKSAQSSITDQLMKYLKNPMSDEERNQHVRAAIDAELSSGASIKDLSELYKTFGLSDGKEETIELVDFKKAFPDLASAIAMCSTACPKDIV